MILQLVFVLSSVLNAVLCAAPSVTINKDKGIQGEKIDITCNSADAKINKDQLKWIKVVENSEQMIYSDKSSKKPYLTGYKVVNDESNKKSVLTIEKSRFEDTGIYKCVIKTETPDNTAEAKLIVFKEPNNVCLTTDKDQYEDGAESEVKCTASEYMEDVTIQVKLDNKPVLDGKTPAPEKKTQLIMCKNSTECVLSYTYSQTLKGKVKFDKKNNGKDLLCQVDVADSSLTKSNKMKITVIEKKNGAVKLQVMAMLLLFCLSIQLF